MRPSRRLQGVSRAVRDAVPVGGWVETTQGAETGCRLGRNHPTAPGSLENLYLLAALYAAVPAHPYAIAGALDRASSRRVIIPARPR